MSDGSGPWWRDRACLSWIVVALAVRVAYAWNLQGLEASDPVEYDAMAWNVAQGIGFTNRGFAIDESWVRRPPLFVFFLAGVYWVFGHDLFAARMAQCVLGTALCAATIALGAAVAPLRTVRRVAAVAALYPYLVYYSGYLMSETLATLWFTGVLWALARRTPDGRSSAIAGAMLGLASLTRSSYLGFAGPLLIWLRDARRAWRPAIGCFAIVVAAALLAIAPWLVRNYHVTGRIVPIQSTSVWGFYEYHLWFSQDDFPTFDFAREDESWKAFEGRNRDLFQKLKTIPPLEQDAYFRRAALRYVVEDPARYLRSCLRKFVWLWRPSTRARAGQAVIADPAFWLSIGVYSLWLPLFVVGLWRLGWAGPAGRLLVWAVVYVTALHTFYWYGAPRFRFPIYPVFIVACCVAVERRHAT
jgi:4-amino-4-deoxy-L-arabinose transferase-like glycosyltransferase